MANSTAAPPAIAGSFALEPAAPSPRSEADARGALSFGADDRAISAVDGIGIEIGLAAVDRALVAILVTLKAHVDPARAAGAAARAVRHAGTDHVAGAAVVGVDGDEGLAAVGAVVVAVFVSLRAHRAAGAIYAGGHAVGG